MTKQEKALLDSKTRGLKGAVPSFVSGKTKQEIKEFIDFSIVGLEKNDIETKLLTTKTKLQEEKNRLNEPQKVLQLETPNEFIPIKINIISQVKKINIWLGKDYAGIQQDVLEKFNKHILDNFIGDDGAESWISKGLTHCKDINAGGCPFCGQTLSGAQELIKLYGTYFDKKYKSHIKDVEDGIQNGLSAIETTTFSQKTLLQTFLAIVGKYKELSEGENLQQNISSLQEIIGDLNEQLLNDKVHEISGIVKSKRGTKLDDPYKKVDGIDFVAFEKLLNTYNDLLNRAKKITKLLSNDIEKIRKQYSNIDKIKKIVSNLESKVALLDYKKNRIDQDTACIDFKALQKEIATKNKDISVMQDNLETDQSQYLKEYFVVINELFESLGSDNFVLDKEVSRKGHLPVCYLNVTFHGEPIPNDKLRFVFSESDRRALALSVFLAKVSVKPRDEKANTIVVFDDPVVSFDDNRVINSIRLLKDLQRQVGQIIIFTHYPSFIKIFCERTKESEVSCKYVELKKSDETSYLENIDRNNFLMSNYDKEFIDIYGFINRKHDNCVRTKLRLFLEALYIPTFFAKQIHDNNVDCSSLERMIDGVFTGDTNSEVRRKFHTYRNTLNY